MVWKPNVITEINTSSVPKKLPVSFCDKNLTFSKIVSSASIIHRHLNLVSLASGVLAFQWDQI